jgi:hypothetical protein
MAAQHFGRDGGIGGEACPSHVPVACTAGRFPREIDDRRGTHADDHAEVPSSTATVPLATQPAASADEHGSGAAGSDLDQFG